MRSRALRTNDRGDGTGLDEQEAKGATTATTSRFRDFFGTVTFVTITMLMQRCENIGEIRLTRTTIQHNDEAGMRDDDLYRQRLQQLTVGLALAGLQKGGLFVLKKTCGFALTKADFRFYKSGLFRF